MCPHFTAPSWVTWCPAVFGDSGTRVAIAVEMLSQQTAPRFLLEQAARIRAYPYCASRRVRVETRSSLAGLGHEVTAVDFSAEALRKTERLARERKVKVTTVCADLGAYEVDARAAQAKHRRPTRPKLADDTRRIEERTCPSHGRGRTRGRATDP